MDDQNGEELGEFYSIEEEVEEVFVIKYEFDAPQFYDFNRLETECEAKEADLWFESAGNYPPSPFVTKFNWRYDINGDEEIGNGSIDCDDGEACNCCNKGDLRDKTNSQVKSSLSKSSTLMQPTVSYLAKLKQSGALYSNQLQRRFQKSLGRFDNEISDSSYLTEVYASKRQKLEAGYLCKVAYLKHQALFAHKKPKALQSVDSNSIHVKTKVTVPREPELQTARRAQTRRSKLNAESDKNAQSNVYVFKALPLNKKILEAPSFPFPKKTLPQPPAFQLFRLRTSERARQHASNNAMELPNYVSNSRKVYTGPSRSFNLFNTLKEEKSEVVNKSKACPLNKKVLLSKVENGILQTMKENTAAMDFKFFRDRGLPDEPPTELFNKLSLSSEVHSSEKSGAEMAVSNGFKENEPSPFLLQCQMMNVSKENSPRNGGMQYQCRSDRTNEIGQPLSINRQMSRQNTKVLIVQTETTL